MRAFRAVCRRPFVSSFNAARTVGAAWSLISTGQQNMIERFQALNSASLSFDPRRNVHSMGDNNQVSSARQLRRVAFTVRAYLCLSRRFQSSNIYCKSSFSFVQETYLGERVCMCTTYRRGSACAVFPEPASRQRGGFVDVER